MSLKGDIPQYLSLFKQISKHFTTFDLILKSTKTVALSTIWTGSNQYLCDPELAQAFHIARTLGYASFDRRRTRNRQN
jgi:hypothetical protein